MANILLSPPEERICPTVLWVSGLSAPAGTAGAIAHRLREYDAVRLRAIGLRAGHQALKAVARSFLAEEGKDLVMVPAFRPELVEGEERVVLEITVYRVKGSPGARRSYVSDGAPGPGLAPVDRAVGPSA